jgi:glutathione synthase/RimK-type ligase-like ATP-grasp enzyme
MYKICVVARNFQTYFIQRLISVVGQGNVLLSDPRNLAELPVADFYFVRTTGIYRNDRDLELLEKLSPGSTIINPLASLKIFRDKPTQYSWLQKNSFSVVPWLKLRGKAWEEVRDCFETFHCEEVVVKPLAGQGGWGVKKLDERELQSWWQERRDREDEDYLAQPFVKKAEYRVFFLPSGKRWVLRRIGDELAANFAQGGKAEEASLPFHAKAEVERLIESSGTLYGAIDLFVDPDSVFFLELNTAPGMEQLEQVTRGNIMLELLKAFKIKN